MKISKQLPKYAVLGVVIGGLGLAYYGFFSPKKQHVGVDVRVPELSAAAVTGKVAFDANCAKCHGKNAAGTDKGPPLVHKLYTPGHHSDRAFFKASQRGARRHHWPYGNMKPLPNVTDAQLTGIVKYVRELQVANGIK